MMSNSTPPLVPARPHEVITPNGSKRIDPYAWLRDDSGENSEVADYLYAENAYGQTILDANIKLEKRILYDMDSRVPRKETKPATPSADLSYWYGSTRGPGDDYWVYNRRPGRTMLEGHHGPLSYGPDLKFSEQMVLDVNKLAEGFKYCDVGAVKSSPDGRYVAFTVDTVGNEEYECVVQEIGSGRRVAFAGAADDRSTTTSSSTSSSPVTAHFGGMTNCAAALEWSADSSAVFALLLTSRTHEPYKLVRCKLLPGLEHQEPELLLQDDKPGAVLEMAGRTSCGRFLMLFRKAEGYSALLALTLSSARRDNHASAAAGAAAALQQQQPRSGVPDGVKLYGTDPWVVVAPESDACDVLRADHLYSNTNGKETFAVLGDTDKYPDGHVCAVTGGDIKRRTTLVPGKRGRQIVDIAICGECGSNVKANGAAANATTGRYLVVHMLEDMKATVQVYDLSTVNQLVAEREKVSDARRQRRLQARAAAAAAAAEGADKSGDATDDDNDDDDDNDNDINDDDDDDDDGDDGEGDPLAKSKHQRQVRSAAPPAGNAKDKKVPAGRLTRLWTFSPGAAISSLHIDHGCWPGTVPYVRASYSNLTTPTTTVDLDLAARKHFIREVERVGYFSPDSYMSQTLWATSADGTRVPATLACRTDAWPSTTGRPLPCILQAYGAYGRKLLPDFIPGDLAILDGGAGEAAAAAAATTGAAAAPPPEACGPCLMVIAHARGGGELGSRWHVEGKRLRKINTAEDIVAVLRMLVSQGFVRPEAVAVWGRSAGGLAMGMTLQRCPGGTFRTAVLDVPFLDVLGAMTDTSLPLTVKEQPEWGDPASSQEDYDYILSYSPYEHVEALAVKTPALIVTCSRNDPRVPYWGPAKFVARLRAAMATAAAAAAGGGGGGGPVMLLTELDAGGHFAASGASGRLAERAMRVAFMLRELKRGMDAAAETPAPLAPAKPAAAAVPAAGLTLR